MLLDPQNCGLVSLLEFLLNQLTFNFNYTTLIGFFQAFG